MMLFCLLGNFPTGGSVRKTYMRIGLKSAAIAVALALNSLTAGAAGLGKLNVLSALGQPLKAEVDISASRDEVSALAARLAPAEAFKQQGIQYSAALSGIRMVVDKRPSGQPYIRIIGDRPLNEPFLELLVELSWGSGRLVREYTFLLDPPVEITQKAIATPVSPPEVKGEAKAEAKTEPKAGKPADAEPAKKPAEAATAAATAKPAPKMGVEGSERAVKSGDTLGKIAAELKPDGVNLDQMLVALFRGNPDAFSGENMNRLRAGRILKVPEREEILAVDAAEARQVITAQSADFNAYRKKLAGAVAAAPAKEEAPKQAVAGKITPKVEDKAPAAPVGKDKLEVSRTEAAKDGKGGKGGKNAVEEDIVARDQALKAANSRIAELEKNLADLKKLAELKSQAGAQLQTQSAKPTAPEAKKPEVAPVAAPVVPSTPAKPAEPEKAAKAAEPAKPVDSPKPPVAKKPVPPPPPPEPTFMEEFGDLIMMGGAALVAGLLGFFGLSTMRRKRKAKEAVAAEDRLTGTDLSANSVFGATGGQSVDTGAALHTDFGKAGHDEGVDPVAEADVYMAYGRDAQAEEILIEALKKEPSRHAIHVKLLEIYSARKSVKQFETLAMDLKGQTGGSGSEWEKAVAMGRAIDPNNALYMAGEAAKAAEPVAESRPVAAPSPAVSEAPADATSEKMRATVTMPGQLAQMAAAAEAQPPAEAEEVSLDFDLDLGGAAAEPSAAAAESSAGMDFDLDLGSTPVEAASEAEAPAGGLDIDLGIGAPAEAGAEAPAAGLDIDFAMDFGTPATEAAAKVDATAATAAEAEPATGGLDFDFGDEAAAEPEPKLAEEAPAPGVDLSAISLDLGEPEAAEVPAAAPVEPEAAPVEPEAPPTLAEDNPEVATKLELAQAYEEMGDKDGARELLQEVLAEGSAAQQEIARARLAKLA